MPEPLRHRLTVEPVSERKAAALARRAHPGEYQDEPLPPHICAAVTVIEAADGAARLRGPHETLWIPAPVQRPFWFQMAKGVRAAMLAKYGCATVAVRPGDVVVDCGAYVGGFALAAADTAARVIAVEPAPVAFRCLSRNLAEATGAEVINAALGESNGTATLFLHANSTDSSLLDDPAHAATGTATVERLTLPALMRRCGIAHVDFLKLEAEGAELEVLRHVRPEIVSRIAIDAGPERYGQSPLLDIAVLLARRGYRLANRNYWLYAEADGPA